jgi:glycosyltransferase involved in cell wall biosynthesis
VIPHGHYRDAYPAGLDRATARKQLGVPDEAPVILYFGLIRPYKNVPHLITTFADAGIAGGVLLVAGKPYDQQLKDKIEATARATSGADVRLALGHIAAEDVQRYFLAADVVALPYRRILNSGAVILALGFGRPVLVPDKGSMAEHQEDFGEAWVRLYDGELEPEDLRGALAWARGTSRPTIDLSHLEWSALALRTKHVYESL